MMNSIYRRFFFLPSSSSSKLKCEFSSSSFNQSFQLGLSFDQSHLNKIGDQAECSIDQHKSSFFSCISKEFISPLPILVTHFEYEELERIQKAICSSIKHVVSSFHQDQQIQSIFNFSDKVRAILDLYKNMPYERIGTYR